MGRAQRRAPAPVARPGPDRRGQAGAGRAGRGRASAQPLAGGR
jgi:hypothetical protein